MFLGMRATLHRSRGPRKSARGSTISSHVGIILFRGNARARILPESKMNLPREDHREGDGSLAK